MPQRIAWVEISGEPVAVVEPELGQLDTAVAHLVQRKAERRPTGSG